MFFRRFEMREFRLGIFVFMSFLLLPILPVRGNYFLTDLDSERPTFQSMAYAINNNGQVVGRTYNGTYDVWRAASFDAATHEVTELSQPFNTAPLFTCNSAAWDINDQGIVVGEETYNSGITKAIRFDNSPAKNNTDLGNLGGTQSMATRINNSNMVVGHSMTGTSQWAAATFDAAGGGCTGLFNGSSDKVWAINDSNQFAGETLTAEGSSHAFAFTTGKKDLGILPGGTSSYALSINNDGDIVGYGSHSSGAMHAIFFDPSGLGRNIDLGTLGGPASYAYAINDEDKIVGKAMDSNEEFRATIFDSNGNIDLNKAIVNGADFPNFQRYTLVCAQDINNQGQIVGYMNLPDPTNTYYITHAFLLTPVHTPEPSSLLSMLGLGLPFFRYLRRKH